jgi:uncharacterized phage-associated protein
MRAEDVASYFLSKTDPNREIDFTNMKLQKHLYYAQGYHLALYDEPLFENPIEAWDHGPVVYDVWLKYSDQGNNPLPSIPENALPPINQTVSRFLDDIFNLFMGYSAFALRQKTHEETPWKHHYKKHARRTVIPNDAIKSYFHDIVKIPSKSTLKAINDIKNKKNLKYFDSAEDMKKSLGFG